MKKFIRAICLILCLCAVFTMAACRREPEIPGKNQVVTDVTFPLAEPVTFTFMIEGTKSSTFDSDIANNKLLKKLTEETNVHLEFQFIGNDTTKLNLLITGGTYGDVIWGGPILNSVTASKYIAAGKLTDLTDYINEDLMPEFCTDLAESPDMKKMITAPDGRIYTLPKITGLEGNYLESPIWINKAWLDKVGLPVPTTLDEFTNVLRAFSKNDPNGNGLPDEIPYIACSTSDYSHLEALAGIFGIATKDGVNDGFIQVKNGQVTFVPISDAYKDYIKWMNTLYKEGLLWSECFTANESTMNAKMMSETCVVGCFTSNMPLDTTYADDYICIAPPKAEGYTPCWYYHPAINGSKNQFYVTDKCQNVSVLMGYIDKLFSLENAIAYEYGSIGEGRVEMTADGKYSFIELDSVASAKLNREVPTLGSLMGNGIRSYTTNDFANSINFSEDYKVLQNNYAIYKDFINTELWPRPYYAAKDCNNADLYVTDINLEVQSKRAAWITGNRNIDSDWESFKSGLNKLGLQDYMRILQEAYDAYNNA